MCARVLSYLLATAAAAVDISVTESGASGRQWAPLPGLTWTQGTPPAGVALSLNASDRRQGVMGFGAAFTDTSAYNAMVFMYEPVQAQFLEALWGSTGLGLNLMRVTINSADYSFQSFNYDNVTDDFSLVHFDHNLTYDRQRVMPLIRAARAVAAAWTTNEIKLFGSPWSPPGWMKRNGDMINSDVICLKDDVAEGSYQQTWANYIVAWLDGYAAAGLPMWGLTPQNEPEARQLKFESCAYDVAHYVEWVGQFLGPAVKQRFPELQVMAYDHNKVDSVAYAAGVYNDSRASAVVDGFAVHWYDYVTENGTLGLQQLDEVHALSPTRFILNTEACVLEELVDGWGLAWLYAADILGDLNHHVSGWVYWNSALLTGDKYPFWRGGPNHDNTTKFGDPVLFEFNATGSQRLIFQPSYWVIGHVSRFAPPNSVVVGTAGGATTYTDYEAVRAHAIACSDPSKCPVVTNLPLLTLGIVSPDGAVASMVVVNANAAAVNFSLVDSTGGGRYAATSIPRESIQTYSWKL